MAAPRADPQKGCSARITSVRGAPPGAGGARPRSSQPRGAMREGAAADGHRAAQAVVDMRRGARPAVRPRGRHAGAAGGYAALSGRGGAGRGGTARRQDCVAVAGPCDAAGSAAAVRPAPRPRATCPPTGPVRLGARDGAGLTTVDMWWLIPSKSSCTSVARRTRHASGSRNCATRTGLPRSIGGPGGSRTPTRRPSGPGATWTGTPRRRWPSTSRRRASPGAPSRRRSARPSGKGGGAPDQARAVRLAPVSPLFCGDLADQGTRSVQGRCPVGGNQPDAGTPVQQIGLVEGALVT